MKKSFQEQELQILRNAVDKNQQKIITEERLSCIHLLRSVPFRICHFVCHARHLPDYW